MDRHRRLPRSPPPAIRVDSFAPSSVGPRGPALRAVCLARLAAARLTILKVLRGIFRKRRHLLTLLFHNATSTLQDAFRIRLGLPHGRIGAITAVHTYQEKITWNATTKTVIYRSKRHYNTKRNFEIFKAPDFIAAILRFREGSFEWQAVESLRTQ